MYTVKPLLAHTPNSGHLLYSRNTPMCALSKICINFLGMTVGFTQVTNTAIESAEYVEVCVDVLIPGQALRNFTVILIPDEGKK